MKSIKKFFGNILISIVFLCLFLSDTVVGQNDTCVSVVFYNVENLFDINDNTTTRDDDFTKDGFYKWTKYKLEYKIKKISRAVFAATDWEPPLIIGLCEIENRDVLNMLISNTSFNKFNYKICHYDSPDERGIDVALLYNSSLFKVTYSKNLKVDLGDFDKTRDILYVKGTINNDTIHIFVNHWPSRYGGKTQSDYKRLIVSNTLRMYCDSLFIINSHTNIIIMGDLNDEPNDESVKNLMLNHGFVNLKPDKKMKGTIRYKGQWGLFDQILVSEAMFDSSSSIYMFPKLNICTKSFLLVSDEKYLGEKPYRTFQGPKYLGGYSDHLPVSCKILIK